MKLRLLILTMFSSFVCLATVNPVFTASTSKGCSPLVVNFNTNTTTGATSYRWELGNGNTSTQNSPSATYFNPGIYTVKLIVSNGSSTDSSMQTITVFSPPSVDFSSDRTAVCPNDSIQFTNLAAAGSAPISQYAWGFGNGIASSKTNAAYRYPLSGTYDVTLVVQDTNGCDAHLTKVAYMTVWPKPVAAFTPSPSISCGASQLVNLNNQSSGSGLSYSWVMGDSTFSTQANPTHTYAYGNYIAKLYVVNSDGCVDSAKKDIAVIDIVANFSANKVVICAGETVHFADESPTPGTSWRWNFGDGTTSSKQNPGKSYATPGVYSITFRVNQAMCMDSNTKVGYITVTRGFSVGFAADNQNSCTTPFPVNFTSIAPAGVSLNWNFGNGTVSTATDPSTTYNSAGVYTVSLTAVDSSGCEVIATAPGFINTSKPAVKFVSDTLFCLGTHIVFTNRTINATRYLWNFGDGDTSTQISPMHIYNSFGYFNVSLTAWDSIGCDSTLVKMSYIHIDSTKVDFNVSETFSNCPPLVSVFTSQANRPDLKYYWDFGDGFTDTVANPTHIFFHPGLYTVKLKAVSKYGCSNTVVYSNLINVQGPSGTFSISERNGCVPVTVNFNTHKSSNTQSVVCDLGDGTLYHDSLTFNYTYHSANIFHPRFILTDQIGCSVAYSLDSVVSHPYPRLDLRDTSICAGNKVNISLGNDHYQWRNLPVGTCDTCSTLVLQPTDTAAYAVTAITDFGCTASASFSVNVDQMPVLIAQDTIKICKNSPVDINMVQSAFGANWSPSTYLNSNYLLSPTSTPEQDVNYTVTAYNRLGCTVSEHVAIKVYSKIPLALTHDTAVCSGSPVQLTVSSPDTFFKNVTYTWSASPYLNSSDITDPIAIIQSGTETFQVTAHSGICPATSASVTIHVNPAAQVTLPETIVTTPGTELAISPILGDLLSYSWSASDSLSCTECSATSIVAMESQFVYVSGRNEYGCATIDSVYIHVLNCDPASIFVPNTFTPNNDGTNDRLYVRSKTLRQLEYFRLYDRWGAVVFESRNINEGWDGTVNGKIAQEGVYIYQVSGKCQNGYDVATSGSVTLIR